MKKYITHIILFVFASICLIFEYVKYNILDWLYTTASPGAGMVFALLVQFIIIVYIYVLTGCVCYFFTRKGKAKLLYLSPMIIITCAMIIYCNSIIKFHY